MRVKNSVKNMVFGIGSQIMSTCFAFITRTVFIYILGVEYLGIEGLFANILSMLSLANLGIESAIIFSLYKPLNDKNEEEIKNNKSWEKTIKSILNANKENVLLEFTATCELKNKAVLEKYKDKIIFNYY